MLAINRLDHERAAAEVHSRPGDVAYANAYQVEM